MTKVMVERHFEEPREFEELQGQEEANSWCLETNQVQFIKTFFSVDRKTMFCLYEAPDAEAVRRAQEQAGMPFSRIYAVTTI